MENLKKCFDCVNNSISNIKEKDEFLSYEDVRYISITQIMHNIAKDGAEKIMKLKFPQSASDECHKSVKINGDYINKLGIDSIIIYAYKGYEFGKLIESNYSLTNHGSVKSFSIDIYNFENITYGKVYAAILQELANFQRDVDEHIKKYIKR